MLNFCEEYKNYILWKLLYKYSEKNNVFICPDSHLRFYKIAGVKNGFVNISASI